MALIDEFNSSQAINPMTLYHVLDWFFMIIHPALILFNITGWIWKKTRKANLILLLITGGSWLILGIWYGIGYCPLTDWHFGVLRKLTTEDLPHSYIKYLADRMTGWKLDETLINYLTASFYFLALICSLIINIRTRFKMKTR